MEKIKTIEIPEEYVGNFISDNCMIGEFTIYLLSDKEMELTGAPAKYFMHKSFREDELEVIGEIELIKRGIYWSHNRMDNVFSDTVKEAELLFERNILMREVRSFESKLWAIGQALKSSD